MSEIPKAYEPQSVEDKWYDFWLKQNCFTADPARVSQAPAYSIVIPPPNVTGMLHMGHVLNNTIQDILARKARMDGKEVLWLPGTDHAGIATRGHGAKQTLKKEEKKIQARPRPRGIPQARLGSGRKSTAASSSSSSRSSAARAIGRANGSRWTRSIRAACRRCSSSFTRRA